MRPRPTLNGPLTWSLLSIGALAVLLVVMVPSLISAVVGPSASSDEVDQEFARLMSEHEDALARSQDRFVGRSVFFKPRQPRPPRAVTPIVSRPPDPQPAGPTTPPPPPPPPSRPPYGGPTIHVMIGDEVWFDNGLRLRVGQDPVDGLSIVNVNAPWGATVSHKGWEYELGLFSNGIKDFLRTDLEKSESTNVGADGVEVLSGDPSSVDNTDRTASRRVEPERGRTYKEPRRGRRRGDPAE